MLVPTFETAPASLDMKGAVSSTRSNTNSGIETGANGEQSQVPGTNVPASTTPASAGALASAEPPASGVGTAASTKPPSTQFGPAGGGAAGAGLALQRHQ